MSYDAITVEHDRHVALVTMNRPERLNAWNAAMARDLDIAMRACDADDDVRAVVLTGAGRAFCAGADLSGGGDTFSERRNVDEDQEQRGWFYPWDVRKPVIAAIGGAAVGVGATYPLTCDIRYAADDAKIGFVFVRRGMLPELSSHAVLPRVVGLSRAAELLMSGRIITGAEAAAIGLVSEALPRDAVLDRAIETAHEIATNSNPVAVAASKRLLWRAMNTGIEEMGALETPVFERLAVSPDSAEGVESFLERRDPDWNLTVSADYPEDLLP